MIMKVLLSGGLLFLAAQIALFGQNAECIISSLYSTETHYIKPLSGERWAILLQDMTLPGALGEGNGSIAVVNKDGRLEKIFPIDVNYINERSAFYKLWTFNNDDILMGYATGNCDSDLFSHEIHLIDSLGHQVWSKFAYAPYTAWSATDGNLIMINGSNFFTVNNTVQKLERTTGDTIWEFYCPSSMTSVLQVPGTDDFLLTDKEGIKYFKFLGDSDPLIYQLQDSVNLFFPGHLRLLNAKDSTIYYGYDQTSMELIRFHQDLSYERIGKLTEFYYSNYVDEPYVYTLRGALSIDINSLEGILIQSFQPIEECHCYMHSMAVNEKGIAIVGEHNSGKYFNEEYKQDAWGRYQGWFRFLPKLDFSESELITSTSITGINEIKPISIDSFYENGPDYEGWVYWSEGGEFEIEIYNSGEDTIRNFDVNITFGTITNYWFCPPTSALFSRYENQFIPPGESAVVHFDDIVAYRQTKIPAELCFWTSAPNGRPDNIPEDDRYCFARLVKTNFPINENISLYPNPADDEIHILNLPYNNSNTSWTLFDAMGRIIKEGKVNVGEDKLEIKVKDLSPGIYIIQVGKMNGRFIVQH